MSLNKSQLKAVDHINGPLLVLSGPGSGKTTVIVNRVVNLIKNHHIKPENILVVTFTANAAKEMNERFFKVFNEEETIISDVHPEMVTFGTFHSVFFNILKEYYGYSGENIIREWEKIGIVREILTNVRYDERYNVYLEDTKDNLQLLLSEISKFKHNRDFKPTVLEEKTFIKVYNEYTKKVNEMRKIDFEDMLYDTAGLFESNNEFLEKVRDRYKYILIDEYQDINEIQNKIISLIAWPENNVFAVGDDDQAIYGFRGASPRFILEFEYTFKGAGIVCLEENYRCSSQIIDVAGKLIKNNKERFEKTFMAGDSSKIGKVNVLSFDNMAMQCEFIVDEYLKLIRNNDCKKVAVLYRTNSNSLMLSQLLTEKGIAFTMKDKIKNIYDNPMIIDILTYLKIAAGDDSRNNYFRIINKPYKDIPREIFDDENVDLGKVVRLTEKGYENDKVTRNQLSDIKEFCMGINFIKGMNTFAAISYIRYGLKYQFYMEENRRKRKVYNEDEDIFNLLEIMQYQAKKFVRIEDFLGFVEDYQRDVTEGKLYEENKGNDNEKLVLSTIHSSKGLEYDCVFIMDANERIIPHGRAIGAGAIEEERRLFYVAMTRAAKYLYVLYTKERYGKELPMSRFVREIKEDE